MSGASEETAFPRGGQRAPPTPSEPTTRSKKRHGDDFLFGSKPEESSRHATKKPKHKQHRKETSSLLPVGGGGVVPAFAKKEAYIEALGFSKLAKGTKLLAVVKEVHDDHVIVSLPNLLSGYILKREVCGNG